METIAIVLGLLLVLAFLIWKGLFSSSLSFDDLSEFAFDRVTLPDGMSLNYRRRGNPDTPTVLLVHGGGDSLSAWDGWATALEPHYDVVAVDLPGHGLSDPFPDGLYSTEKLALAVKAFVDTLGLKDFIIVGHSFGGETVLRYVTANPRAPKAMILVAPGGYEAEHGLKAPPAFVRFATTDLGRRVLRNFGSRRLFGLLQHKNFFYRKSESSKAAIDRQFRLLRYKPNRGAMLSLVMNDMSRHRDVAGLTDLTLPALFLWGREDRIIPLETGRRIAGDVPNAGLVIYENMGHVLHVEMPERSSADALRFLQGLS